jgi:hypothetical protein
MGKRADKARKPRQMKEARGAFMEGGIVLVSVAFCAETSTDSLGALNAKFEAPDNLKDGQECPPSLGISP